MILWVQLFLGVGVTLEAVAIPTDAFTGNTGTILGPACQLANTVTTPTCSCMAINLASLVYTAGGIVAKC
jgi:hypothetical protein